MTTTYALRFIAGRYKGGQFPLRPNREVVIGRGSEFDMVLDEDMVSRRHAKIATYHGQIVLQDLKSTNGTFVNGERITVARLKLGDKLLVGSSIMEVITSEGGHISQVPRDSGQHMPLNVPIPDQPTSEAMPARTLAPGLPSAPSRPAGPATGPHPVTGPPSAPPSIPPPGPASLPPVSKPPSLSPSHSGSTPTPGGVSPTPVPRAASAPPKGRPVAARPTVNRAEGMSGRFPDDDVTVPDLVELFTGGGRTGALTLIDPEQREGRIFFRSGVAYYATIAEPNRPAEVAVHVDPLKCFNRLITWPSGEFSFASINPMPTFDDELTGDTRQLLVDGLRQYDELMRYHAAYPLPGPNGRLSLKVPLTPRLSGLSPEALDTLQLVLNFGLVGLVLDHSPASDLETWQDLLYLMQNGYLEA